MLLVRNISDATALQNMFSLDNKQLGTCSSSSNKIKHRFIVSLFFFLLLSTSQEYVFL